MIDLQKPHIFDQFPNVTAGISLVAFGQPGARELGFDHLVLTHQVHGATINETKPGLVPETGDALITHAPGFLLGIRVADCAAVLIYDADKQIVANVHSGWRGSKAEIVAKTIDRLKQQFGSDPNHLWAYVSPMAQACCYEVGQDFLSNFPPQYLTTTRGKYYFNNQLVISDQLLYGGVPLRQIEFDPRCTIHDSNLPSYRRTKTSDRMLVIIGLSDL